MLIKIKSDNLVPIVSKFFKYPTNAVNQHKIIFSELSRRMFTSLIQAQIYVNTHKHTNI